MLLFYLIILILSLYGLSFTRKGFNPDYIGKTQCNAIKGIFILIVFVRHVWPYISRFGYDFSAPGDGLFMWIDRWMGQLIVASFFFYSGYGVMESFKRKGRTYVNEMPRKRILNTLVNYDIAVLVFLVMDLMLGVRPDLMNILLALTSWSSIGNSNWYICVILICYLCTWIGLKLEKGWITLILLTIAYIILLHTKTDLVWYNTIFTFAAGILYSKYVHQVEPFVQSRYWVILPICLFAFLFVHTYKIAFYGLKDNLSAILLALSIVLVTMKVHIGNRFLVWCGTKLFPLYIYQRIPMIFLSKFDNGEFVTHHPMVYVWSCLLITLAIAFVYRPVSFAREKT